MNEKSECYKVAFEIARQGRPLTEKYDKVFKQLRGFLDGDVANKIDTFKPGNKGILFVGGDDDLLSGLVSYVWYVHPLHHLFLGNEVIKPDNAKLGRNRLIDTDFYGYSVEEISKTLFSEEGLINNNKFSTVLFLRDIDVMFTQISQRLLGVVRNFKFKKILERDTLVLAVFGQQKKLLYHVYDFNILIINTTEKDKFPDNFGRYFEIIDLEPRKKKRNEVNKTELESKQQEVESVETQLSYNNATGKFRFGTKESVAISSTSRAKVRNIAIKLMEWWLKGKPCPLSEFRIDPTKKTPQKVHDYISDIRKALKYIKVNMPQFAEGAYPPPSEPKHFDIIKES